MYRARLASPLPALMLTLLLALLLGLCANPTLAKPTKWPVDPSLPAQEQAGPVHLSVLDLLGRIGIAIIFVYAIAFALSRSKGLRPLPLSLTRWLPTPTRTEHRRLRLCENLSLSRQEGTLYLVEVDGQTFLLGAGSGPLQVLWSPPTDGTSSFKPVTERAEERSRAAAPEELALADRPLSQRGSAKPPRRESDWARERSRLISALMESE